MEITLNRTIAAPAVEVFDAWLDPAHPGSPWYGVERNIMSPVPDGLFYRLQLSGNATNPDRYGLPHYGRFIVVERPRRIQHTWLSQHTRGIQSVVTVYFTAQGQDTVLTLHHAGLPDDEFGRMHEGGWNHYLKALTGHFAGRQ
jgi:uncharacterized protein YndB with AHSA1/START domain